MNNKRLAALQAEIDALSLNPTVYISSCEENLSDRGISMPDVTADDSELLAYAKALRNEILSSYGV